MKKLTFVFIVFFVFNGISFSANLSKDEKVRRFSDRLMELFSYNNYRNFYENHINLKEVSYENFEKDIISSGIKIAGSYESKLIGWEKKGNKLAITFDLAYKNPLDKIQRITLSCIEKEDRIIVPYKEFKKIFNIKKNRSKRK